MTNAPLLPAEAALLIEPSVSSAGKCLQAALLTLLGRDFLMISETRGYFVTRRTLRLMPGDGRPLPPHLAVIKNALASERGGFLRSNEVVRALQKWFGNDFRRYIHDHLARGLIERGLLMREDRQFLGLIPYVRYRRTAYGEAQAARLTRLIEELGGMRRMIRDNPDRAIQLARASGVLLVLSPAAKAQIPKLKALIADRGGDGGGAYYVDGGSDEPSGWQLEVDLGSLDYASDLGGVLDGIGSVGDFTGGDGGDGGGDGGGGGD